MRTPPSIGSFSADEVPAPEIEDFYSLQNVTVPEDRPYIWSNTVSSLDGKINFGKNSCPPHVALRHIPEAGGVADWRVLQGGWVFADALLVTSNNFKENESKNEFVWKLFDNDLVQLRQKLGYNLMPRIIVITGSGEVDLDHRAFQLKEDEGPQTIIFTTDIGQKVLSKQRQTRHEQGLTDNTLIQVLSIDGKSVEIKEMCRVLRQQFQVKFLEVCAGGTMIGTLVWEKLLDEYRLTIASHFIGEYAGDPRAVSFCMSNKPFTHETNPLTKIVGIRLGYAGNHIFLRGKMIYRHELATNKTDTIG